MEMHDTAENKILAPYAASSLILGILGCLVVPLFCSVAAIILGHIAIRRYNENYSRYKGKDIALAGIVLGYLGILLVIVILIPYIDYLYF